MTSRLAVFLCAVLTAFQSRAALAADLEGVWSGPLTTSDHPFWRVEDHLCFMGCTPEAYAHLAKVLEYDTRPLQALFFELFGFMHRQLEEVSTPEGHALAQASTPADDPSFACEPFGLVRQILSPLPMRIRTSGDTLVIEYEEWNRRRAVHLGEQAPPERLEPTPFGYSVGRNEGDAFVIETTGVHADIYHTSSSGGGHSEELRAVERYTVHDDPRRLVLELTLHDAVTLREPYRFTKTWLASPELELLEDSCEDIPGRP